MAEVRTPARLAVDAYGMCWAWLRCPGCQSTIRSPAENTAARCRVCARVVLVQFRRAEA